MRFFESSGHDSLQHSNFQKNWSNEENYVLVSHVLAGESCRRVAVNAGINSGMLYQWVQKYIINEYEGRSPLKKGRKPKVPVMKKKESPKELNESEREELIRLRALTEYLSAENEVIKKEIVLRGEKEAAQLKAKK